MVTRKTSVSLSDEAIEAAGSAARRRGVSVSAWLSQAAIEQAWREQAIAAADEMLDEAVRVSGELSPEDERWVAETVARTTRSARPNAE
jgi:sugar/nucleoside kinase (ribokinase family)